MSASPSRTFQMKVLLGLGVVVLWAETGAPALAQHAADANLEAIRAILDLPDKQIDLAKVKLTIDRMIDPGIDVAGNLKQLDAMAAEVKAQLPASPTSRDKLEALRTYLYRAGPWNGHQPFRYDLDDPFGRDVRNKLLPTYLATRKGNCVSMPLLFIILGQKIGLDVTASNAPEHLFVKYRDETGGLYNLEATSGAGFARDAWMRQQIPMTDQALANGIYMRALSKKETVVVIADTLNEFYSRQGREHQRIALAELELRYFPKFVTAMLHIGSASYRLRQRQFVSKYPTPSDIPLQERPYFLQLEHNIGYWHARAEALGWRQPDQDSNARYRETVDRVKSAQ